MKNDTKKLIEIKNLEKAYHDDDVETRALCGVSFDIYNGEFVTIMGPSGSGKSTLMHIIGLLDRQSKGDYLFENVKVDTLKDEELAEMRSETGV